jgi:hypothetical protein
VFRRGTAKVNGRLASLHGDRRDVFASARSNATVKIDHGLHRDN